MHRSMLRCVIFAVRRAVVPVRPFARTLSTKQQIGLEGVTVTKGSSTLKQAVAQQRWVVGDADSFKKCDPCEQGGRPLDRQSAISLLQQTPSWTLSEDGKSISRSWQAKVCRSALLMPFARRQRFLSLTSATGFQERFCFFAARGSACGERGPPPRPAPPRLQQRNRASYDICARWPVLQRLHHGAENRLFSSAHAALTLPLLPPFCIASKHLSSDGTDCIEAPPMVRGSVFCRHASNDRWSLPDEEPGVQDDALHCGAGVACDVCCSLSKEP
jgi:hypothetical protein